MYPIFKYSWYLFDLDGTLLDSQLAGITFIKKFALKHGLRVPENEEVMIIRHEPLIMVCKKLWPKHGYDKKYLHCCHAEMTNYHLFPDVIPVLTTLHRANKKIGIISNREQAGVEDGIRKAGIPVHIPTIIVGCGGTSFIKPNPKVFTSLLNKIEGVSIYFKKAVYIGDTIDDYTAAIKAGLHCRVVPRGVMTFNRLIKAGVPKDCIIADLFGLI